MVRSNPKSNCSEILCISFLPASLRKIRSKIKSLSSSQHFLHYKYMEKNWISRASNSKANSSIWPKIELVRDFMPDLVTCKFKEDPIKNEGVRAVTTFSHCKSMGAFGCRGNQRFDPMCPKTLRSLFPTLMMLHIKFDQDWPTGLRDI